MSRFYMYGNSGSIFDVVNDIKNNPMTFDSIVEALAHLNQSKTRSNPWELRNTIHDFAVRWYGFDPRIERNVYIITDKDGWYQSYLIDLDEIKENE